MPIPLHSSDENTANKRRVSCEKWERDFRKMLELVEPGNPNFDDSRESHYGVLAKRLRFVGD